MITATTPLLPSYHSHCYHYHHHTVTIICTISSASLSQNINTTIATLTITNTTVLLLPSWLPSCYWHLDYHCMVTITTISSNAIFTTILMVNHHHYHHHHGHHYHQSNCLCHHYDILLESLLPQPSLPSHSPHHHYILTRKPLPAWPTSTSSPSLLLPSWYTWAITTTTIIN